MDDRRALMAAVIANPDEDTPRLALADWLQEHGDKHDRARAEFIRLQVEAARLSETDPRAKAAHKGAAELKKAHGRRWLGLLWPLAQSHYYRKFERGLWQWWYVTVNDFLKKDYQRVICEWFPRVGIDKLTLTRPSKRVKAIADSPALGWVAGLEWMEAKLNDDGFRALAASPHTARLSRLEIHNPYCSDAGLAALAGSTCYPNLRAISLNDGLRGGRYSHAGLLGLLNSSRLPKLDELDLTGAQPVNINERHLFAGRGLSRLRVLCTGDFTNLKYVAGCKHLTSLEQLHVSESNLTDKDAQTLADNPKFARLKMVVLTQMNPDIPPLGKTAEKALRDRFGDGLTLAYSVLCRHE